MIKIYPTNPPAYWGTDKTIYQKNLFFPGGEPHFEVGPGQIRDKNVWITAHLTNANDFMEMLAACDAVKRTKPRRFGLYIPYFPAARQDRLESGRAFTLKIYTDIVNAIGADCVVIADPHSEVTPALLNNCVVIKQSEIVPRAIHSSYPYVGVIAPDLGASKKAEDVARVLGIPCIHGHKKRDPKTGQLSGFGCDPLPSEGRYLLVDDICDGGGTFLGLLDFIEGYVYNGPKSKFDLYTTHGIYSKGREILASRFEYLFSTDSFTHEYFPNHSMISLHEMVSEIMYKELG